MQTDKFIIKIRLSNGIWKCDCTEMNKNGKVHYEIDITPPQSYTVKKLYNKVDLIFQQHSLDFIFARWQFAEDEVREVVEEELSNKIIRRLI